MEFILKSIISPIVCGLIGYSVNSLLLAIVLYLLSFLLIEKVFSKK